MRSGHRTCQKSAAVRMPRSAQNVYSVVPFLARSMSETLALSPSSRNKLLAMIAVDYKLCSLRLSAHPPVYPHSYLPAPPFLGSPEPGRGSSSPAGADAVRSTTILPAFMASKPYIIHNLAVPHLRVARRPCCSLFRCSWVHEHVHFPGLKKLRKKVKKKSITQKKVCLKRGRSSRQKRQKEEPDGIICPNVASINPTQHQHVHNLNNLHLPARMNWKIEP